MASDFFSFVELTLSVVLSTWRVLRVLTCPHSFDKLLLGGLTPGRLLGPGDVVVNEMNLALALMGLTF